MKKYSRAQCLQVVFKWFSKKCIYIPQERAYKMLTIGESNWRVWSCLLYYFFQRFKFEMFPNTKVWREVHARKDSQIPRLPSLIALTPDRLTKRGIFSELSSTPPHPSSLATLPGESLFSLSLLSTSGFSFWVGVGGAQWAGQLGGPGAMGGSRHFPTMPWASWGSLRFEGFQNHPPAFWGGSPIVRGGIHQQSKSCFWPTFHIPSEFYNEVLLREASCACPEPSCVG